MLAVAGQREAAARLAHSGAGVTCPPPCNATSLTAAVVDAHGADKRRGALRSSAALHETGGVGRAGDLVRYMTPFFLLWVFCLVLSFPRPWRTFFVGC